MATNRRPPGDPEAPSNAGATGGSTPPGIASLSQGDLARLLSAVERVTGALYETAGLSQILSTTVDAAAGLIAGDGAAAVLRDEDPSRLRIAIGAGLLSDTEAALLPLSGSFEGAAITAGAPRRTQTLAAEVPAAPWLEGVDAGPALAAPMGSDERAIGVLLVARQSGAAPFLEREAALLAGLALHAGGVIAAARARTRVRGAPERLEAWRRFRSVEEELERYESLESARGQAGFVWSPDDDRIEWTRGVQLVAGAPSDALATLGDWLQRVHPADRTTVRETLESARDAGSDELTSRAFHLLGRDAAAEPRPMVLRARREPGSGRVLGVVEAEREESSGSLPSRAPTAAEVVNALRHEINNPLAVVIGQAQLLRTEKSVGRDAMVLQSVDSILRESERIAELVKRLGRAGGDAGRLRVNEHGGLDVVGPEEG